jgi:apolipoprotein N-acyltransferase
MAGLSIILAWGWKRAMIALAAGALSALAMAPFNAWPVLFVTFPVAVWLIDGAAAGKWRGVPAAAMAGFWFGLGYFVPGLYWTGNAFLVDAPTFAWLMPFAVLGLPAYLALFPALGFALARLIWTRDASRVLALAIGLTASEWLRGHVLSGFPWTTWSWVGCRRWPTGPPGWRARRWRVATRPAPRRRPPGRCSGVWPSRSSGSIRC